MPVYTWLIFCRNRITKIKLPFLSHTMHYITYAMCYIKEDMIHFANSLAILRGEDRI